LLKKCEYRANTAENWAEYVENRANNLNNWLPDSNDLLHSIC